MRKMYSLIGAAGLVLTMASTAALADGDVYGPFPVTVKDYSGKKTNCKTS